MFLLMIHVVFVVKYRRKLLESIREPIKDIFRDIEQTSLFVIDSMEIDTDHIHFLISYPPTLSVTSIVRKLKSESTRALWYRYPTSLKKFFWKQNVFWSPSYFACSVGNADQEVIQSYIENQGRKPKKGAIHPRI